MNKLAQARTALNEAISLGDSHDPKGAVLHELICTLNDMFYALSEDIEYHPRIRQEVTDSSDIHQLRKDMRDIHQKMDSLMNQNNKRESVTTALKPTYAQTAQTPKNQIASSQIDQSSPKMVIPVRKDLDLQEFTTLETDSKNDQMDPNSRPWTTVQSRRKKHQKQTARISRDRRLISVDYHLPWGPFVI